MDITLQSLNQILLVIINGLLIFRSLDEIRYVVRVIHKPSLSLRSIASVELRILPLIRLHQLLYVIGVL